MANKKSIYRIHFLFQGSMYIVYAKHISQSNLFGFFEIEDLIFGTTGGVVVDPAEEKLRNEFKDVKRCYISMHAVLRIDEVEKGGEPKIVDAKETPGNVAPFPIFTKVKND
jgi:hypothetical protein